MNELEKIINSIKGLDQIALKKAEERLDKLAKPIGSLGELEKIAIKLAGIFGNNEGSLEKALTIVMASDHGITEEGVSCAPQKITALQTLNILNNKAAINIISSRAKSDVKVVDIGIAEDIKHDKLIARKIRYGTDNFHKGPAMSMQEAIQAIKTGIEMVEEAYNRGYKLIGTGEMGIGNTSCSSAVLMAITGCTTEQAVGLGGGITQEAYNRKKMVIKEALDLNFTKINNNLQNKLNDINPYNEDIYSIVSKVGGLDLLGMTGCFIGAAYYRLPIVIDGFISAVAALTAYTIQPLTKEFMIASHFSAEAGYKKAIEAIGLEPMLNLKMRLGEGTGCPIAFTIIQTAADIINNMASFEEASIDSAQLVDIRA